MAGQPDPEQVQAEPCGDLELDDCKADGEADPAPEDLVELGVGRVAVFGSIGPTEAELAIEDVVEAPDDGDGRIAGVEPDPDTFGDRVQLADGRALVDRRAAEARDQDRADREVDLRLRPRDEARKPGAQRRPTVVDAGPLLIHRVESRTNLQSPATGHRCSTATLWSSPAGLR